MAREVDQVKLRLPDRTAFALRCGFPACKRRAATNLLSIERPRGIDLHAKAPHSSRNANAEKPWSCNETIGEDCDAIIQSANHNPSIEPASTSVEALLDVLRRPKSRDLAVAAKWHALDRWNSEAADQFRKFLEPYEHLFQGWRQLHPQEDRAKTQWAI